jgi:hypothetical protein
MYISISYDIIEYHSDCIMVRVRKYEQMPTITGLVEAFPMSPTILHTKGSFVNLHRPGDYSGSSWVKLQLFVWKMYGNKLEQLFRIRKDSAVGTLG